MALAALEKLLDENRGGVWFLADHADVKAIAVVREARRFRLFPYRRQETSRARSSSSTTRRPALHFPADFGHNWDALEECLTDLEWVDADGYVIYYDHIDGCSNAHPTSSRRWSRSSATPLPPGSRRHAMVVLLSGTKAPKGVAASIEEEKATQAAVGAATDTTGIRSASRISSGVTLRAISQHLDAGRDRLARSVRRTRSRCRRAGRTSRTSPRCTQ
jgi:hypothetical protein